MYHRELFSVVIPCYNHAAFLPQTVESVLQSTYPDIEIIIVDDGSVDDSGRVAQELEKKHVSVRYVHQENSGPSRARNNGIRQARGTYILPLDADDLISPHYIAEAVEVLQAKPDVKVVYCEAEKFGEKSGRWKLKPFSRSLLARDNMIFVSGIYRKTDWEACGGYSEDMTCVWEDWEFWIAMLKDGGQVVKLPHIGFYYRICSTSRRKGMTDERKRNAIHYINTKHKDFIYSKLNGPLRFQRTWSKAYNTLLRKLGLLK